VFVTGCSCSCRSATCAAKLTMQQAWRDAIADVHAEYFEDYRLWHTQSKLDASRSVQQCSALLASTTHLCCLHHSWQLQVQQVLPSMGVLDGAQVQRFWNFP